MKPSIALVALLVASTMPVSASSRVDRPLGQAAGDSIFAEGFDHFYFIERYSASGNLPPFPVDRRLAMSSTIQKADVGLIVDTTSSMAGEIAALKNGMTTIIPVLKLHVQSLGIGVAAHDDFPFSAYGASSDLPFYFPASPQGLVTTVSADTQAAVNALTVHNGSDKPESQIPAFHHALAGSGITWPTGQVAPVTAPAGTFGALQFRADALPIVLDITDAPQHNGKRARDRSGTAYDTSIQNAYSFPTSNADDVVSAMVSAGAKYIGIAADNGTRSLDFMEAYGYDAFLTDHSGSNVPPDVFPDGACHTGLDGNVIAADGPTVNGVQQCRSVYSIDTSGAGLASAITSSVIATIDGSTFDIYVQAYSDPAETIDVVASFMATVEPMPAGGTDVESEVTCATFPVDQLADHFTGPAATAGADGDADTIARMRLANAYCFKVTAKANISVPATTSTQVFRAWLRIVAIKPDGAIALGEDRPLYFLVPAL